MLLRLQNFDMKITYGPRKEMVVANTLSWYAPICTDAIELDLAIHHKHITPEKKKAFQGVHPRRSITLLTVKDHHLWMATGHVPNAFRPCHAHRDVMTVEGLGFLKKQNGCLPRHFKKSYIFKYSNMAAV